jgi:Flp pilus assembly protein TadD
VRYWKAIVFPALSQVLPTVLQQGRNAFRAKDWARAERLFDEAVRSQPARAPAHKWLGMTYAAQGKFVLAEEPFRRACEIDQKEPDACYY